MSQFIPSSINTLENQPARWQRTVRATITILVLVGFTLYGLFWLMQALPSQAQSLPVLNTIYYVTEEGTVNDDCSQTSPCTLQRAADLAADGDTIHVAGGTYQSDTLTPTLYLDNKSVLVAGGFDSNDWTAEPDPVLRPTVLDGGANGRVVRIDGSANPIIEGFTIRNGLLNGQGAGVFVGGGSATLRNNVIANNTSINAIGAAVYVSAVAHADIISNTIRFNNGNAIIAVEGTATIAYNIIHSNVGSFGVIRNYFDSSMAVIGNLIFANQANQGGGIHVQEEALLVNNTIVDNSASTNGGGIFIALGTNVITITNNIVANNAGAGTTGIADGTGGSATIDGGYNNIFNNGSDVTLPETVIDDPQFINPANGNYRLREDSPNINAGDPNTDPAINIDLDGNPRPNDGRIDIGAYEFYPGRPNFTLEPSVIREFVERDTTAVYTHVIENIGTTVTDT